jgi:quinol monooxygenase YgiN
MEFVQIVEYETDRPDEVRALYEELAAADGRMGGPTRVTVVQHRDNPERYLTIAEFDSYDEAMTYSQRPETGSFAARIRNLAVTEPRFANLNVVTRETP